MCDCRKQKSPRWERLAFPKSLATRISPAGGFLGWDSLPGKVSHCGKAERRPRGSGTAYPVGCPDGAGAGPGGRMKCRGRRMTARAAAPDCVGKTQREGEAGRPVRRYGKGR